MDLPELKVASNVRTAEAAVGLAGRIREADKARRGGDPGTLPARPVAEEVRGQRRMVALQQRHGGDPCAGTAGDPAEQGGGVVQTTDLPVVKAAVKKA